MALSDQVQKAIETYIGSALSATTATAFFDGGNDSLIVEKGPIISITTVFDVSASATVTATAYDFYTSQACIFKKNGGDWGNEGERKRFRVDYVYGYASIPDDIQLAIDTWVNYLTADNTGALKSYKTGDDSETYGEVTVMGMPSTVKALLSRYRRIIL
jgi:hypothetical protein